jgi:hypothetical protein
MILAKLAYSSYNQPEPIIFRLYDFTAQEELTRTCVINETSEKIMNPTCLEYFGTLPNVTGEESCTLTEDCGCTNLECVVGDETCTSSDAGAVIATRYAEGSHLIKVQFQVINYHTNHWERVFGIEIDDVYLSDSSVDVVVFDANPQEKFTKKHGTETFNNESRKTISFDTELTSSEYSLALSCDKNINLWYSNKTSSGFVINSELPFSGEVDWSIVNINPNLRG